MFFAKENPFQQYLQILFDCLPNFVCREKLYISSSLHYSSNDSILDELFIVIYNSPIWILLRFKIRSMTTLPVTAPAVSLHLLGLTSIYLSH